MNKIIRKNRNSVAILTGKESQEQLKWLSEDIFRYYGLGCRNVSKLFVPENYDFNPLFENEEFVYLTSKIRETKKEDLKFLVITVLF